MKTMSSTSKTNSMLFFIGTLALIAVASGSDFESSQRLFVGSILPLRTSIHPPFEDTVCSPSNTNVLESSYSQRKDSSEIATNSFCKSSNNSTLNLTPIQSISN